MPRSVPIFPLWLCFLLPLIFPAGAAAAVGELTAPGEQDRLWQVSFQEWRGSESADPDLAYLSRMLPVLIRSRLLGRTLHTLSAGEKALWDAELRETQRQQWEIAKAQEIRKRDTESLKAALTRQQRLAGEQLLREYRRKLASLHELPLIIPDTVTLEYPLFQPERPLYPQSEPVKGQEWVITGAAVPLAGDYYRFEMRLISFLEETDGRGRLLWQDAGRREDLTRLAQEAAAELAGEVAGMPLARLTLSVEPDTAQFLLDGQPQMLVAGEPLLVAPGPHLLSFSAEGFADSFWEIELAPEETAVLSYQLEPHEGKTVLIGSDPPGAQVYRRGVWVGETPLEISVTPEEAGALYRLELPDHYARSWIVGRDITASPADPYEVELHLPVMGIPARERLEKKKDAFYFDLGLFVVSTLMPVVFNGVYRNYEALYIDTWNEETRQAGLAFYYAYGVSLTVSGGLFVKTLFSLNSYLQAAGDYVQ